jgi:hypothetical protein
MAYVEVYTEDLRAVPPQVVLQDGVALDRLAIVLSAARVLTFGFTVQSRIRPLKVDVIGFEQESVRSCC